MKTRFKTQLIVLVLCGSFGFTQSHNAASTAHGVDEHYNHLKNFKSAFTEIYQGPGVSKTAGRCGFARDTKDDERQGLFGCAGNFAVISDPSHSDSGRGRNHHRLSL